MIPVTQRLVVNIILFLAVHSTHIRKQMFIGFVNNIVAVILSVSVCYGIATELDYSENTMSWYNNKLFAAFLYVIPTLFTFCFVHRFIFKSNNLPISLSLITQSRLNGTTIMWSLLLLAATAFNVRSAYMFLVPLVITLLSNIIISITGIQNSSKPLEYYTSKSKFYILNLRISSKKMALRTHVLPGDSFVLDYKQLSASDGSFYTNDWTIWWRKKSRTNSTCNVYSLYHLFD